jgi:hypothetical protein
MKAKISLGMIAGLLFVGPSLCAQAPAGAPAGTTGKCKDGTYTSQATKQGACRGHKGVDTWYAAASASTPAPAAKSSATPPKSAPAPTPAPAATPAPPSTASKSAPPKSSDRPVAPGGGQGMVWVNTESNVYHCYGTQWYGKTKAGKYESEAAAKTAGARPDHGKGCGQ